MVGGMQHMSQCSTAGEGSDTHKRSRYYQLHTSDLTMEVCQWPLLPYCNFHCTLNFHASAFRFSIKVNVKGKGKRNVDLHSTYTRNISKALKYSTHCQGISQFYLHALHFIRKWNEPHLLLPSQPQLVQIY